MEVSEANLFHIDSLLADTFHDQMTLVTVPHMARPDGTPEFHYHNLVFGGKEGISGRKNHHRPARPEAHARDPRATVPPSAQSGHSTIGSAQAKGTDATKRRGSI